MNDFKLEDYLVKRKLPQSIISKNPNLLKELEKLFNFLDKKYDKKMTKLELKLMDISDELDFLVDSRF